MLERIVSLLHIFGWAGGIIYSLLAAAMISFTIEYEGSVRQLHDKLKGYQSRWPCERYLLLSVLCWSIVYITW